MDSLMSKLNSRFSLKNKTAIVTGALGYLGKYFCLNMAEAYANIVVTDLDLDLCKNFSFELQEMFDIESIGIECDVTSEQSLGKMLEEAIHKFSNCSPPLPNSPFFILLPKFWTVYYPLSHQ